MKRRTYLRAAGASALAVGLAGCGGLIPGKDDEGRGTVSQTEGRPSGTTEPGEEDRFPTEGPVEYRGIEFDRVLDAERDFRMDANGNRPIDGDILELMSMDRTLLRVRPGRYKFHDEHRIERAFENIGIVGVGDSHRDVVFWTPETEGRKFLNVREGGSGFLLENVTFDHMDGDGSIGSTLRMHDKLRVHTVEHIGHNPTDNNGAVDNLIAQVLDSDGRGIIEGFVRAGPTNITSHGHLGDDANEGCIYVGGDHAGELLIRDSHIENTGTNAIYASRVPGNVIIENTAFVNNNQASLRIGGEGSVVRDCRFLIDTDNANPDNGGEYINPNAILWETGSFGKTGGRIEGCEFVYRSAPPDAKAAIWADGSAGAFTVSDTSFEIDVPGITAIRADDPEDPRLGATAAKPWGVTLSNVVIDTSEGVDGALIRLTGRPNSVIDGCCLSVSDARGVIKLAGSPESAIQNLNVMYELNIAESADVVNMSGSAGTLLRDINVNDAGCAAGVAEDAGTTTPDASSLPEGR